MRLIKCQKCSTQFNVDTDKAKTDVFTVVCPRCGQKYQLRKAGAEVAKPPVGRVAQVGSVGSPKGQVPPAPVAGIAPDLDLSKFNPRSGWQYHLYASTKWIPYWKHVALSLYLNKLIQGVSTAFKDLTSSGRLTKEHVTAIRSNMTATCSTVFRASISPVLRIWHPRLHRETIRNTLQSITGQGDLLVTRTKRNYRSQPCIESDRFRTAKKDTHQQPVTNGTNARINAPARLPVEACSQQVINEVASAPLRSAPPLQVEAPAKPPLKPFQTQTPRSKRTHNPWLIGSLSALLLGVGIYGLIELSKRHTLTEAERSQAGDWFSDLRSEQWVLVSSADPSATEYLLTLNPSPVTADSYGKTTIRLEVELRPTASGTNERYVAVEERPYTDLSEPSELYLTDGNEEIGAGTSIMLRRSRATVLSLSSAQRMA
ncbi:MAG: hypothetical protein IPL77_18185 [Flavobacteriales bacterium]|nr:hypothetical protein [Flavobacteriales bacterium]